MIRKYNIRPNSFQNPSYYKDRSIAHFEVWCDEVSDLPYTTQFDDHVIDMGSIAYIINTAEIYVLNSDEQWILQNGDEHTPVNPLTSVLNFQSSDDEYIQTKDNYYLNVKE